MHTMKVQTKYYRLLKSGQKTIELRLFDEKRQQIKIGDMIQFSDLSNLQDTFTAKVIALHRAPNFNVLTHSIQTSRAGFSSPGELVQVMEQFYSPEMQQQYGVIGIEVELVS